MKKYIPIFLSAFLILLFNGCTQDNWIDWKLQNELWMLNNKDADGVQTTRTGLQYKVLYQGNTSDARPTSSSTVIVRYKGTLINGAVFDETEGVSLSVSSVVSGFAEGLKLMNAQADYILYIPWQLGYGSDGNDVGEGYAGFIPPYSTLIFEIHLTSIIPN